MAGICTLHRDAYELGLVTRVFRGYSHITLLLTLIRASTYSATSRAGNYTK